MQEQSTPLLVWVRRVAAIIVGMFFVPAVIVAIVFSGARSDAIDPDFWIERLQEADFYTFVHDPFVPYLLDEAFDETDEPRLLALEAFEDDIAEAVRVGMPPRDIQQVVEDAIYSIWPYLIGDSDSFEIDIALSARARFALETLAESVRSGDDAAYESLVTLMTEQLEEELSDLPIATDVTIGDMEAYVRRIAPKEWLFEQTADVIGESTPYVIGDVDTLDIIVPVGERDRAIDSVMTDLLSDPDLVDVVAEQSLAGVLADNLSAEPIEIAGLPALTAESLAAVILMTMSPSEMAEITSLIVGDFADYATNQSDSLGGSDARIVLATSRDAVPALLARQADVELAAQFSAIPICGSPNVPPPTRPLTAGDEVLPPCAPPGLTYEAYKTAIGLDLEQLARDNIGPLIPLGFAVNADVIRREMDPEILERIDEMRGWMADGYTVSVDKILNSGGPDDIDVLRETIRDGISFTEADFDDAFEGEPGMESLRLTVWLTDTGQFLLWLPSILLLLIMASVGGRGWGGRLTWASVALAIGAALAWIGAAFALDRVLRPILLTGLDAWLSEGATSAVQREFTVRVNTLVDGILSGLADSIQSQALQMLVIAGITLLIARLLASESVGRRPAGR